ncbi:MAG: hypothetical protein ABGW74_02410 [Campylobacterales bacterium]
MVRIKNIGGIELESSLFLVESFSVKNVQAVSFKTLDGGAVIYESIKRDSANNITLDSRENGWIDENTISKLVSMANDLGVEVMLTTTDGATIKARFRLEEDEVIKAEQIYEGSKWYKVVIKMARV